MIAWHERIVRGRDAADGDLRRAAISDDTWRAVERTYSGVGLEESWQAALALMALFRRLATEVADALHAEYPEALDAHMSQLVFDWADKEP
jgi:hypothetical protein